MKHWQLDILMTGHLFTLLQRVLDVNLSAALNILAGRDRHRIARSIYKETQNLCKQCQKRMKR